MRGTIFTKSKMNYFGSFGRQRTWALLAQGAVGGRWKNGQECESPEFVAAATLFTFGGHCFIAAGTNGAGWVSRSLVGWQRSGRVGDQAGQLARQRGSGVAASKHPNRPFFWGNLGRQ